jgi:predicted GIY-YIG superfamily endonuclease
LETLGWKRVNIKTSPDKTHHCYGGMFAKRHQYGMRPLAATTLHKAMGNDYHKIASCVIDDGISGYRLWDKAQLLVLISRVHYLKNIIFIGNKEETAEKLLELVSLQPKYALYMDYIIKCLTQTSSDSLSPVINLGSTVPFHLCSAECPKKDDVKKGYTYLLISIPQPTKSYIGQGQDLNERIQQHNKGWSHNWTNSIDLRPWACMAYVIGFQSKKHRLRFESLWQFLVEQAYPNQTAMPLQVLHIGQLAITKYHEENNITTETGKLRMIQLLSPARNQDATI